MNIEQRSFTSKSFYKDMTNAWKEPRNAGLQGSRTINALVLGEAFPEIFSRAVVAQEMKESRLTVERIYSVQLRHFLASSNESFKNKVDVLIKIADQFEVMIEFAVALEDRNTKNILVDLGQNVWQVDLEYVINMITGRQFSLTEDLDMGTEAYKQKVAHFYSKQPHKKKRLEKFYRDNLMDYLVNIPELYTLDLSVRENLDISQDIVEWFDSEVGFFELKNLLISLSCMV
jgi:hypothetical protein